MTRHLSWTLLFGLVASVASASPVYPGTVRRELGLQKLPSCTVCHQSLAGGTGTAVKPFARAARERGLTGMSDISKLQAALAQLAAEKVDTDGDGVPDIAELKAGTDPNPEDEAVDAGASAGAAQTSGTTAGPGGSGATGGSGAGTWILAAIAGLTAALVGGLLLTRKRAAA